MCVFPPDMCACMFPRILYIPLHSEIKAIMFKLM